MPNIHLTSLPLTFLMASSCTAGERMTAAPIDRCALVARHAVVLTSADPLTPLQVGNGELAFSADITGLQTFLPANTMSHWGWHTFPLPSGKNPEDLKLETFDTYGRPVGYATSQKGQEELFRWLRENPHRLNLGRLSLRVTKSDGKPAELEDLQEPHQTLDLWCGLIASHYGLDGQPVQAETCCHPTRDIIAVRIESSLVATGRLAVVLSFPYGSPGNSGADWTKPGAHQTTLTRPSANRADFARKLDDDTYTASLAWSGKAELKIDQPHMFTLVPAKGERVMEFVCAFSPWAALTNLPTFAEVKRASAGLRSGSRAARLICPGAQTRAGASWSGASCCRNT